MRGDSTDLHEAGTGESEKRDWLTGIPIRTNIGAKVCTVPTGVHFVSSFRSLAHSRALVFSLVLSGPACAFGQEPMGPAKHRGEVSRRRAADRGTARLMRSFR